MNLSAQQCPISELEAANEAAETLLTDHENLLSAELATMLSTLRGDLTVLIEDHYGTSDDAEVADLLPAMCQVDATASSWMGRGKGTSQSSAEIKILLGKWPVLSSDMKLIFKYTGYTA